MTSRHESSSEKKLFLLPTLSPCLGDDGDTALLSKSNIEVICSMFVEDAPNNGLKPKSLSSPACDPSIHKNESSSTSTSFRSCFSSNRLPAEIVDDTRLLFLIPYWKGNFALLRRWGEDSAFATTLSSGT